jgi:hypothetical protein
MQFDQIGRASDGSAGSIFCEIAPLWRRSRNGSPVTVRRSRLPFREPCKASSRAYPVRMDEVILEQEAMRLPARARALLADALLGSLEDEAAQEIERAWVEEADARLESHRRGEIAALDGPNVLRDLRERSRR